VCGAQLKGIYNFSNMENKPAYFFTDNVVQELNVTWLLDGWLVKI